MIARLTGRLDDVDESEVQLTIAGVTYQLLVSSMTSQQLHVRQGDTVTLHTHYYLQAQGSNAMTPVLLGFLDVLDKDFFQLLTTVDGIGPRAAMRMLTEPTFAIARAIEQQDLVSLRRLPGIGRQKALELVAKLHGKAAAFIERTHDLGGASPRVQAAAEAEANTASDTTPLPLPIRDELTTDVMQVLQQLGYTVTQAEDLLQETRRQHPELTEAARVLETIFARLGRGGTA